MSKPLTSEQINEGLSQLTGWTFENDAITKEFKFSDFRAAMAFMVRVGFEAEEQVHHPEMSNVYNTVSISLKTHDAGDKVTEKDMELAKAIEKIRA